MNQNIPYKRMIIAAYRLPFRIVKSQNGNKAVQNSGGLVSAILSLSGRLRMNTGGADGKNIVWVGVSDHPPRQEATEKIENEYFDIVPIGLSQRLADLHYSGFSNGLLWPLFHYFPSYCQFNHDWFEGYKEVNTRFCDEIARIARPDDFIWIHDYQLLLLPKMLSDRLPGISIGFFLHIPFPSFELFRMLPVEWRRSIIKGMLGADLIGFHTNDYSQHFIKCVQRTTDYECIQNSIHTPEKLVKADVFPIGIDYEKYHDACLDQAVLAEKNKIRRNLRGQKLIFSVDRLDYTKGFLVRLKGYETFLNNYPEWHAKVVFNMVVVPSRDKIDKYQEMKKEIESTVGRINGRFSSLEWRPIIYQYKSLTFNEIVALYDISDVGLITPLRDGMNLVAKEYVACQVQNRGVLILSEMAGAAEELSDALIVNPVDPDSLARAINAALVMDPAEKGQRIGRMQKRLMTYNVMVWALDILHEANAINALQNSLKVKILSGQIVSQIIREYEGSRNRILFLDYDGTLSPITNYPETAYMDPATYSVLKRLSLDSRNKIVVISGRDKGFLDTQFRGIEATLVAEHGFLMKRGNDRWTAAFHPDVEWKGAVMPVLSEYTDSCPGSFIEEKSSSIAWHYRNSDPELANRRLGELRGELGEILKSYRNIHMIEGKKVLELKGAGYDKGQAARELLEGESFDFILAAGDDVTDDFLFSSLPETAHTIKIGAGYSPAKYNAAEIGHFLALLESFAGVPVQGQAG